MKIIIFDFDGVIVDSFDFCYQITNGHLPLTEDEYRLKFEGNINDDAKLQKRPQTNFFDLYTPKLLECEPIEGVTEAIKGLANDYTLVIVSSTITSVIVAFLNKFNLRECFDVILGNEINPSKVKKLQMVLDKYDVSASDTVFVTDTLGDIKEAKQCDIKSIAVSWGYHPIETLKKGSPYRIVNNIKELFEEIGEYFRF